MRLTSAKTMLAALAACCFGTAQADNDFIVYSPYVVEGQSEVEMFGFDTRDSRGALGGTGGYNISVAHAVNSWWKPEVYIGQFNRDAGGAMRPSGYEFENTFQLTQRGEYWADAGLLASYVKSRQIGVPSRAEFGALLEKWTGHVDQRLNLIMEKQTGTGVSGVWALRSAYSVSYKMDMSTGSVSPGVEVYLRPNDNAYQIGPVLYGEMRTAAGSEFEYSIGIVNGINPGAPDKTLLLRMGYEFF